ncbi:hypothetical protein [Agromyces luteolus]|uniref:Uncharacterized protein n=1 Tax=Agromyces luteolus TaxID=88373 RepID=A0A7C9HQI6_9MICO|nr:hypothetical protein [Agromyces luteolus]MUN06909.1 hypothetical protein [Agromyces luteolus]
MQPEWYDSAFLQGLAGALIGAAAAIGGAWIGARQAGKSAAETAAKDREALAEVGTADRQAIQDQAHRDRLHTADLATRERLHQNRTDLIERLSDQHTETKVFYLTCHRLHREMNDAAVNDRAEQFMSLSNEFGEAWERRWQELDGRVTDLTLQAALFVDESAGPRLEAGQAAVGRCQRAILDNAQAEEEGKIRGGSTTRILRINEDRLAYLLELDRQILRSILLLAMVTNPANKNWFEQQYPAPNDG